MKSKMRYFIRISNITKPSNKLHAEMLEFIKQYSNIITNNVSIIKDEISTKINELNLKYPKSTPLVLREWQILNGDFGINFNVESRNGIYFYLIYDER